MAMGAQEDKAFALTELKMFTATSFKDLDAPFMRQEGSLVIYSHSQMYAQLCFQESWLSEGNALEGISLRETLLYSCTSGFSLYKLHVF